MRRERLWMVPCLLLLATAACQRPDPDAGRARPPGAQSFTALSPRVREAAGPPQPAPGSTGLPAPMTLTATDGTGLSLVSLTARAVVEGPLALTELHLQFQNPLDRVLEGRFSITLPEEAAISRFAMLLPSGWQEAEVVERQAARRAYEDALHRRQDPALLEKEAGNQFSARIFPIPAKAKKEIKLSYSQELTSAGTPYRLPLFGLPALDQLDITVLVGGETVRLSDKHHSPERDLVVPVPSQRVAAGLRHDDLVLARIQPQLAAPPATLDSLLVLFDTSASQAAGFARKVQRLRALLGRLAAQHGGAFPLQVACFDQTVEAVYTGPAGQLDPAPLIDSAQRSGAPFMDKVLGRGALGASDLAAALEYARKQPGYHRVLLITDGVASAGPTSGADLKAQVARLRPAVRRLDVLLTGGIRNERLARALVTGNLDQDGAVLDGDRDLDPVARRLGLATVSGLKVSVAGAGWVWPAQLDALQPGDEVLVYAELQKGALAAGQPLQVALSGAQSYQQTVPLVPVTGPLLQRAWVQARIASLARKSEDLVSADKDLAAAIKKEIVELSVRHRVLSDYTALLVLETEDDYRRFGIDRSALADILVVGDKGAELHHRDAPVFAAQPGARWAPDPAQRARQDVGVLGLLKSGGKVSAAGPGAAEPPSDNAPPLAGPTSASSEDSALGRDAEEATGQLVGAEVGESYGSGGLGLVGSRGGGGGIGESVGLGARPMKSRAAPAARAPEVAPGVINVTGALDREVIRRIVRRHMNEVRYCYERELARDPTLQGRVEVRFTIGVTGAVVQSAVQSSTLKSAAVGACVAQAVRRWEFPRPTGGVVIVTYPFAFKQDDHAGRLFRTPAQLRPRARPGEAPEPNAAPAYTGRMAEILARLERGEREEALVDALRWRSEQPGDVMALIALGESLEALAQDTLAARAYGSLIDLFPARADMRRFAGERLLALGAAGAALAVDSFTKAVEQRPDHPNSHRLLAYALLRAGQPEPAFAAVEAAVKKGLVAGRFRGVDRILREDLGLCAAAWLRAEPGRRGEILDRLQRDGGELPTSPSLRFVLSWETDANDVDFHIHDARGGHAFFSQLKLPSGGELYADVTTGYGPECFTIPGKASAYPYRLEAHYYSRGPMGYGMGQVEILQHDGRGGLKFQQRPFVVMSDHAYVDLGVLEGPLP